MLVLHVACCMLHAACCMLQEADWDLDNDVERQIIRKALDQAGLARPGSHGEIEALLERYGSVGS